MSRRAIACLASLAVLAVLGPTALAGPADDRAADGATGRPVPTATQTNPDWLEGVDISHWDGTIHWQKVASAGKRFAVMKATEGTGYVDPTYATNRDGAAKAGVVTTAYHFARPDLNCTVADARAEADHFVKVAGVGLGDVIPVLDLERDCGSKGSTALIDWAAAWLKEVKARTGVRPMIYSGPSRWSTEMNDTPRFADNGYRLWLAHWCSPSSSCPWVPANDWAGHGWTVWQYTDCGHVDGIPGSGNHCVDLDHFDGTSLLPVRIAKLTASTNGAGTVTSVPKGIDCGSTCSAVFDPGSTVTFTATPRPGAVFVSWGGRCAGLTTCAVTAIGSRREVTADFGYTLTTKTTGYGAGSVTSSSGAIACGTAGSVCAANYVAGATVTLTAAPDDRSQFAGWSGACDGSLEYACTVTMDQARTVVASFADDTPPTATLRTPRLLTGAATARFDEPVRGIAAADLVLRVSDTARRVRGTVACTGQDGEAVPCDTGDVLRATLQPLRPLVPGQHYDMELNPNGAASQVVDRAGNTAVAVDAAFRSATTVDESRVIAGWRWRAVHDRLASNRSYRVSDDPNAVASLVFTGKRVTWHTRRAPGAGVARVLIDGRGVGVFDLEAPRARFVGYTFGGLAPGTEHTIRVQVVRGRTQGVAVDGFDAKGEPVPSGSIVYRWARHRNGMAAGGTFVWTDDTGASVRLLFRGTGIRWVTMTGPSQGRAMVFVDGKLARTVDLSADSNTFGVTRSIGGLADSLHSIRIVALGTHRRAATAAFVTVDGFEIR